LQAETAVTASFPGAVAGAPAQQTASFQPDANMTADFPPRVGGEATRSIVGGDTPTKSRAQERRASVPGYEILGELGRGGMEAGTEALTLRGHTESVSSLALSTNGKRLCSAGM
jgi:hypothetical protein